MILATQVLRQVARLIGDRDNAVKSAALDAIMETYFQVIWGLA